MMAGRGKKNKSVSADQSLLRAIPKVDEVQQWLTAVSHAPLFLVKQSIRVELDRLRHNILAGRKVNKNNLSKKNIYISS